MSDTKRRGRPTLDGDTSTSVSLRIPSSDYDRACKLAKQQEKTVSEVLRRGIRKAVRSDEDDDE